MLTYLVDFDFNASVCSFMPRIKNALVIKNQREIDFLRPTR